MTRFALFLLCMLTAATASAQEDPQVFLRRLAHTVVTNDTAAWRASWIDAHEFAWISPVLTGSVRSWPPEPAPPTEAELAAFERRRPLLEQFRAYAVRERRVVPDSLRFTAARVTKHPGTHGAPEGFTAEIDFTDGTRRYIWKGLVAAHFAGKWKLTAAWMLAPGKPAPVPGRGPMPAPNYRKRA